MALPADVSTRTVHGSWVDMTGTAAAGSVTFQPLVSRLVDGANHVVLVGDTVKATLDGTGAISVVLPCTDDLDLTGAPFSYLVTVWLSGHDPYSFAINVPTSVATLELADQTPVVPTTPAGTFVLSVNGQTGVVTIPTGAGIPATTVAGETTYGLAPAVGTSTDYARKDHSHGSPALGTGAGTAAAGTDSRIVGAVQTSRLVTAGTGLSGGGDLSADRTLAVLYGIGAGTAAQGNDSRFREDTYPLAGYGLVAASGDPMDWGAAGTIANNDRWYSRIWIPAGVPMAGLWTPVRIAGTWDAVSTPNQIGLYDDTGVQLTTTANDSTLWAGTGWRGGALLAAQAAQPSGRWVYAMWICRGFTGTAIPVPHDPNDANGSWISGGVGVTKRRGGYSSGTTLPASFDPTTFGTASSYMPLIGVS